MVWISYIHQGTMLSTYIRNIVLRASWGICVSKLGHWRRMTHICVSTLTIIGSDNGLSPGRRQAIIWTNAGILLIEPLGTNFSEMLLEIYTFSFTKMHLKMSGKWRPFCLGLNVLNNLSPVRHHAITWANVSALSIWPTHGNKLQWYQMLKCLHSESISLQWRHNDQDGVSNHQPHGCLLNRLFRGRSKKRSKHRVTGLCVGNSPGPVNSPQKGPVTLRMFPFDDVIMKLQWHQMLKMPVKRKHLKMPSAKWWLFWPDCNGLTYCQNDSAKVVLRKYGWNRSNTLHTGFYFLTALYEFICLTFLFDTSGFI